MAAVSIAAITSYWILLGIGYFTLRFLMWADLVYPVDLKPFSCLIVGTYLATTYFAIHSLFQIDKLGRK